MTVGKSHNDQTHTYQLDSQNLCTVTEEKDPIVLDNDLQFENQILSEIKTANRITGLVRRNFKNVYFPGFLLLYKSIIRSNLEYALSVLLSNFPMAEALN